MVADAWGHTTWLRQAVHRIPALCQLVFVCNCNPSSCYFNPSFIFQNSMFRSNRMSQKSKTPTCPFVHQSCPANNVCVCARERKQQNESLQCEQKCRLCCGGICLCVCSDHTLSSVQLDWNNRGISLFSQPAEIEGGGGREWGTVISHSTSVIGTQQW